MGVDLDIWSTVGSSIVRLFAVEALVRKLVGWFTVVQPFSMVVVLSAAAYSLQLKPLSG